MRKVYAVIEFGGEWEDKWDTLIGICNSREDAEFLKANNRDYTQLEISKDKWEEMCDAIWKYEFDNDMEFPTVLDGMIKLFPQYAIKDLEDAETAYDVYDDYRGTYIKEVDLYESKADVLNRGTNN